MFCFVVFVVSVFVVCLAFFSGCALLVAYYWFVARRWLLVVRCFLLVVN